MTIKGGRDSGLGDRRERVGGRQRSKRNPKLNDDPCAITNRGNPVVNVTYLDPGDDLPEVVRNLLDEGHEVFVGVVVSRKLRPELQRDLDDALADVVGRLGPRLRRSPGR